MTMWRLERIDFQPAVPGPIPQVPMNVTLRDADTNTRKVQHAQYSQDAVKDPAQFKLVLCGSFNTLFTPNDFGCV